MLKVFIADDDSIIRRGLKTMIELNTEDFEVVGEAADGLTALELIQKLEADLVITDIKMPVMDGVELVKNIGDLRIKAKVIVLSGYDEYGFVRETLKNGAVDYILKPVQKQSLLELFNRVKRIIENEKYMESNKKIQEEKLEEGVKALKEQFLHKWIKGYYVDQLTVESKLQELGYCNLQSFMISIIRMDYGALKDTEHERNRVMLLEMTLRQLFEEIVEADKGKLDSIYSVNDTEAIIIFLNSDTRDDFFKQQVDSCLDELRKRIHKEWETTVTIGCSKSENDPNRAHVSYDQALLAVERKFYIGKGEIISYDPEVCSYKQADARQANDAVDMLVKFIELGDSIRIKKIVLELFDRLVSENLHPADYRDICSNIFARLCSILEEFKDVYEHQQNVDKDIAVQVQKLDTLKELKEYFSDILCSLTEQINFIRHEKSKKIIEMAKNYILKHFHEDISLKDVAEHVFLNPNYLSELFKTETGKNFIDFLTGARIDAAKKSIKGSNVKINEVGSMVGYNDPSTFLRAFKKIVGISPSEYKKIIK